MPLKNLLHLKNLAILALTFVGLLGFSNPAGAVTISLSSDVMLNGGPASNAFPNGYTNTTGVEIVRGGGSLAPYATAHYTASLSGPTIDLSSSLYGAQYGGAFNMGANIHGRGGIMFAPGDGETTGANNLGIGFGTHGISLITFDLDAVRASHLSGSTAALSLGGRFAMNGQGGPGETVSPAGIVKGIVFLDGVEVFESANKSKADPSDLISLAIPSSAQYLTFVIQGGDNSTLYDDGTFRDMNLSTAAVPEPSRASLLGFALVAILVRRRR